MNSHRRALILNADYTPISLVNWKSAIKQEFSGCVQVIDFYPDDKILTAGGMLLPCPAVAVLREYKKRKSLKGVPFSRSNVFIRDRLRCQYCGVRQNYKQLTYDHVVPRSKFKGKTPTIWTNIVTCCNKCNTRKSDMLLSECDMNLLSKPYQPQPFGFVLGVRPWTTLQPEWIPYMPKFYLELLEVEDR